eukprot:Rhum_TRINITY_DN11156_c0_g1::Rhum_TRINITY_DN11156_c0_g1_i1::g.42741::m.42741
MSIHINGTVFADPATTYDVNQGRHGANFAAANAQLAGIEEAQAHAAAADATLYAGCVSRTAQATANANTAFATANSQMAAAKSIADTSNYRTLYSPSSAYGPVGPCGATAPFTSPYVAGYLHQR